MNALIPMVVALLSKLIPAMTGNAGLITEIVNTLVALVPVLIKEYNDLLPMVKNIIEALKADPATTQTQLDTLQKLDVATDAAFEAASLPQPGDDDYVEPQK